MELVRAERLEPKQVFRCVRCDRPPKPARVRRRYRFILADRGAGPAPQGPSSGAYCLPCASRLLGVRQGELRRQA
jgi:hypothetical protein